MDKMLNILALMSVPLSVVICRAWIRTKELEVRGTLAQLTAMKSDCAELRQRIETLETIATGSGFPEVAAAPPPRPRSIPAAPVSAVTALVRS